jgi:hypothetical protein
MVLRLAEALQVPRERNALLLAGGYAPIYQQTRLDSMELQGAREALDLLMSPARTVPRIRGRPILEHSQDE